MVTHAPIASYAAKFILYFEFVPLEQRLKACLMREVGHAKISESPWRERGTWFCVVAAACEGFCLGSTC